MPKEWKCKNYEQDYNDLVHEGQCDCIDGCNGELCFNCCEEEMFGNENEA